MYLTKKKAITQYIVNQDKDFIRYKKRDVKCSLAA